METFWPQPVGPDGLNIFSLWPTATMKICPIEFKILQKYGQNFAEPLKKFLRLWKYCQSVEISPNLVTLCDCQRQKILQTLSSCLCNKLIKKLRTLLNFHLNSKCEQWYLSGFALIAMANVGCNQTMSIVWLCIAVALSSSTYSGFQVKNMGNPPGGGVRQLHQEQTSGLQSSQTCHPTYTDKKVLQPSLASSFATIFCQCN